MKTRRPNFHKKGTLSLPITRRKIHYKETLSNSSTRQDGDHEYLKYNAIADYSSFHINKAEAQSRDKNNIFYSLDHQHKN